MNETSPSPDRAAVEAQALVRAWAEGRLQPMLARLLAFAAAHRGEILAVAGTDQSPAALGAAVRRLIADRRSVDLAAELREQMTEIHKEIWYRGERGDHDRDRIKDEWVQLHAANWRRWLLLEYAFIAHQCAPEIAAAVAKAAERDAERASGFREPVSPARPRRA